MKTLWCGVCLLVAVTTLAATAQSPGPADQDKAAVRQAAYDYGEGFYEGAAERMERGVHPAIIKRGLVSPPGGPSFLQPMNAETLVEIVRQGGGKDKAPSERNISYELLDIRDNVASAKIFTVGFNDYLHLVKQDGRWRIAHVLWQPPSSKAVVNGEADKAASGQAVKDFMEGIGSADVARIERATHPEASLRMFRPSPPTGKYFLIDGNRDLVVAQIRMKRMPPLQGPTVAVLDLYDNIASALVTTTSGPMAYAHIGRQNGQWRVVNLLLR